MTIETWTQLAKRPEVLQAVAAATGDGLAVQKQLRELFPAETVRLALTLAKLRQKASPKFTRAESMWFDAVRLEQATSEIVARHKAQRFHGEIEDLCCGLGADSVALAQVGEVRSVDLDPLCEFFVRQNANVYGVAEKIVFDLQDATQTAGDKLIHIDPDRRDGDKRMRRIEDYCPDLTFLQKLTNEGFGGAIKVSSASNFGGKFPNCEIELVSVSGECKEATIWFGALAGDQPWRATTLPSGETIAGEPLDAVAEVTEPLEYVFDPDPALVRSGLIDVFCVQHDLQRVDDAEEYLTAGTLVDSAFIRAFRVLGETANNDRKIRQLLRAENIGPLEVKTRHVKVDANMLQKKFSSKAGERPGVLFIAKVLGRTRALLCERVSVS